MLIFYVAKGGERYVSKSYVPKEDDIFIIFTSFLMLVLCIECYLYMFELVKICTMQLFLDYWFEGEGYFF